jgi:ankyrin repeat protein
VFAIMQRQLAFALLGIVLGTAASAAELPPLVAAAKAGNRTAALQALAGGADPRAGQADGTTALHWAVRLNDAELTSALLAAGANPSTANRYGVTPLYLAAQNGSAAIIEQLLDAGADANEIGTEGETVLMTVSRTGRTAAADVLLERGAEVDARESWHGQTALMWAAAEGHEPMVRRLLEAGADPNLLSNLEEWERQRTAEPRAKWLPLGAFSTLLFAAREGCSSCVATLASAGADLNQTTPEGHSAVVLALINGYFDTAMALLNAGADPNLLDEAGRGALYAAIDFNTMPSSNRPAPQVLENRYDALDVATRLLALGANPNVQLIEISPYRAKLDRGNDTVLGTGTTPLLRAAKAGDIPAIELLLANGADPTLTTERGVNALMLAAGLGTAEQDTTGRYKTEAQAIAAIDILLAEGLDIDASDERGRTALHGAALQGFDEVVAALVDRGANLIARDNDGHTPLDTALGLAGGWGFSGRVGVVQESTVALIERLQLETGQTEPAPNNSE